MAQDSASRFVPVTFKRTKPAHRVLHDAGFKIIRTPGDGFCLIHAFLLSWSVQLISRTCPSFYDVTSGIFMEAVANREAYLPFLFGDTSGFTKALKMYIINGFYKSDFCDIVPLILSNVFGVNVVILNENAWTVDDIEILPFSGRSSCTIYIHRYKEHYSGLNLTPVVKQRSNTHIDTFTTSNRFSPLTTDSKSVEETYNKSFPVLSKSVTRKPRYENKKQFTVESSNRKQENKNNIRKPSEVLVVGTSHARGVGAALNRLKINAISFSNPGCNIHHISRRIHTMVPRNFSGKIIVQVGGNDCSEMDSESVIGRYEALLFLIRNHAPDSKIYVSEVPPRFKCPFTRYKIRTVNDFLHHLSVFEENIKYISHPCYENAQSFKNDGIHLNSVGFEQYIKTLASSLQDFHLPLFSQSVT